MLFRSEILNLKKQIQLQRLNTLNNLNKNLNTINNDEISCSFNNTNTNQTQGSFHSNFNLNLNNTNITSGFIFDQEKFKDIVKEIKKNCEGQVTMKQKIISGQNEINKLSDIIEMNKNISSINNNLSNLISFTGTKNSKDKDKDKENSNNSNNSNNNNSQEKYNLNEKIEELKKNLCSNQTIYKEFHKKIDKIINSNSAKKNLSQLQKDFLITIIKNSNYKIQIIKKYST